MPDDRNNPDWDWRNELDIPVGDEQEFTGSRKRTRKENDGRDNDEEYGRDNPYRV